jgi:hypothetical protein
MGRKRDGNHSPQKNNSIQDLVGNEVSGYTFPDLNKTMINVIKEPSNIHIQSLKKKFMEKILDMVNQNVQDAFKKFQDTKNNMRRHRNKQRNSERTSTNTRVK